MAPRTVGGLTHEMAHGSHILHKNYEIIGVEGLAPTSAFSRDLDLRSSDLDHVVHGGHNLETAPNDNISEFTYIGGPIPSLVASHGQIFHSGGHRPMPQGKLTQGMASTDHILLGNHEVIRTDGLVPNTSFYPV